MGGHDVRDGVALGGTLQLGADPGALGAGQHGGGGGLIRLQRAVVEIGGVLLVAGVGGGVELDVEHALGDDAAGAGAGEAGVLDGVFEEEEDARRGAGVALVNQQRALLEQIAMAAEGVVDDGVEQGMTGADEGGGGLAAVDRQRFFECDALVAAQDGHSGPRGRGRGCAARRARA